MIRSCVESDFEPILEVINDSARAYEGVISTELYKDPFVSREYLRSELEKGVCFQAYCRKGILLGVMGIQDMGDVTLIRHSYVRTE